MSENIKRLLTWQHIVVLFFCLFVFLGFHELQKQSWKSQMKEEMLSIDSSLISEE